jgi:hypothetical protein
MDFFKSGRFKFGQDLYLSENSLLHDFNKYCKENNYGKVRWSTQYTMTSYIELGLTKSYATRKYPNTETGQNIKSSFVIGIDYV